LSQTFRENMLRQIVGFEIVATKLEGKFKLSQNRTREDQGNVIASLEKAEDSVVSGVAQMMKEQRLGKLAGDKEGE
jgi:transcriptional regulator